MRFSRRLPRVAIAAASLLFLALAQSAFGQRALTVADLYDPGRRINFSGRVPGGLTWLDDRHYVERQAGGPPMRVEAMTGERAPLVDPARLEAAIAALPDVDAGEAGRAARRTGHVFNRDYTGLVFELEDDLYHYDIEAERVDRLTESSAAETEVSFSSDGRFVAFVREGNSGRHRHRRLSRARAHGRRRLAHPQRPAFTVYAIRHSFAAGLRRTGTDVADIQDLYGHTHPSTTMIYAPPQLVKPQAAIARLRLLESDATRKGLAVPAGSTDRVPVSC